MLNLSWYANLYWFQCDINTFNLKVFYSQLIVRKKFILFTFVCTECDDMLCCDKGCQFAITLFIINIIYNMISIKIIIDLTKRNNNELLFY